jgi:hypothetical protein
MGMPEVDLRRGRLAVLLASLLAFLVSANIAWLNPSPDFEVYRTGPVPFLWQYNPDAGVELVSAAWFPEAFRMYPERIGRPLYPALVNGASHLVERVAAPIRPLSRVEATGIAYAGFKLLTTLVVGQIAFGVLRRRISAEAAALGAVLMLLHWHMIEYAAAFHTTDLQLSAAVLVVWMALRVRERAECRSAGLPGAPRGSLVCDTFVAGLAVGILLLAKQTLVAPLAIVASLLLSGRFLLAATAVAGGVIPTVGYLVFLRGRAIDYVSWEVEEYGQGRWVLEALGDPRLLWSALLDTAVAFPADVLRFYGPILALALFGAWKGRGSLPAGDARWILLAALATFFQYLAVQRQVPYMTADLGFVVFGAAAVGLEWVWSSTKGAFGRGGVVRRTRDRVPLAVAIVLSLVMAGVNLVNLPWVPPSGHLTRDPAVLDNRIDILERPDSYSDEARRLARGGRLVAPDLDQSR